MVRPATGRPDRIGSAVRRAGQFRHEAFRCLDRFRWPSLAIAGAQMPASSLLPFSCNRLQVRLHHPRHSAHLRRLVKFIDRSLALPITIPQRFERHIEPNLVPVLETVGHRFGRRENPNRNLLYFFFQHAVFERRSGKAHDA